MIVGIIISTLLFIYPGDTSLLPSCSEYPIVQTVNGPVRGYTEPGINGREYFAFTGIPYAQPPVGPLRFEAPQKPDNWTEVLDVQQRPPYCLQKDILVVGRQIEGQEDCLYLNVYVPKHVTRSTPLPVMVFIHWGAFLAGYATADYEGPEYLLEKRDVILVTMASRLGIFGFLTTNNDIAPGNYGLKDQALSLEWVYENIEYFSGDKNQITLWGQGSGSASVHFLMLSPLSRNLFQYAISESGTALNLWAQPFDPQTVNQINRQQAAFVGCPDTGDMAAIIACLKEVPGDVLLNSQDMFKFFSIFPLTVYLPTIETKTRRNPKPFITKPAIEYIRDGEFSNIPWILGTMQDDGRALAGVVVVNSANRETLNANFDDLMPQLLALSSSTNNVAWLWEQIKTFYFHGKGGIDINDNSTIKAITDVVTDRLFAYSPYQTALLHRLYGHHDIWFYNFNYTGEFTYGTKFADADTVVDYKWRSCHCDALLYLFTTSAFFEPLSSPKDIALKNFLTNTFINFAETGNPNGITQYSSLWKQISNNNTSFSKNILYLDIQGDWLDTENIRLEMKRNIRATRYKFWEMLPLSNNIPELDQNHIDL